MKYLFRPVIWMFLLLAFVSAPIAFAADHPAPGPLSFAERVACVEKVEDIYWAHRNWPESNPGVKPPRAAIVSRQQVAKNVETSLLFEAALELVWGESLNPGQIQSEMDRIARSTQHPELLRDVFAALDHDAYLVAECYVRPRLAERNIRERYSRDSEIHAELRLEAESALLAETSAVELEAHGVSVTEVIWRRDDPDAQTKAVTVEAGNEIVLSPGEFDELVAGLEGVFGDLTVLVGSGFSPPVEDDHGFSSIAVAGADDLSVRVSSARWPKQAMDLWFDDLRPQLRALEAQRTEYKLPETKVKSQCIDDTWEPTSTTGTPPERFAFSTVWTGAEMIIWAGNLWGTDTNTGGRYDPAADSWTSMTTTGAPSARSYHAGVWTGTEMVVWGGFDHPAFFDTGGQYNPSTNSWTATSTTGAADARSHHTAVWSGAEMIVWGGNDSTSHLASGGRYNPVSNTWSATSMTDAPSARRTHTAVWAGTEMIIWGGNFGGIEFNTGARYFPATNTWVETSTTDVPAARRDHTAVWTGTEMIVWGGSGATLENTGGRYDPATDTWSATSTNAAPSERHIHSAVWTGTEMIVWGGRNYITPGFYLDTGGRYDPSGDTWTATSTDSAPTARWYHAGVWSGATPKMIVWGGENNSGIPVDGGLYCVSGIVPYDFGDAPDPTYPTLLASDGARHRLGSPVYLGTGIDADDDGQPTANADGDDNDGTDDEDGVVFTSIANPGGTAGVDVEASEVCLLNAWVDFNTDGNWDDAGEQIFTDQALVAGVNSLTFSVPSGATVGVDTVARFRVDSAGGLLPTGTASDGEVEDHLIMIEELDFGDAPDPTFPTLLVSNGARHVIDGTTYLGATVDAEPDGQPNANANGDDNDAQGDDEDGITFMNTPFAGRLCTIRVTASTAGSVNAWIDYNADGDWADAGEHIFVDVAVVAGQNFIDFTIPITATTGVQTFGRFRFSTTGGLSFDGLALDGEVEDNQLTLAALDYGDAPDPSYPTLDASDGARHEIGGGLFLGATVDHEADGQPTAGADGDDSDGADDEDGIVFTSGIGAGLDASLDVTASGTGILNAWVDFNSDGDWADAGEQIFTDQVLVAGVNPLSFAVPAGATLGTTYARFRLDSSGGLSYGGLASDGEVEDYMVEILEGPDLEIEMIGSSDPAASGRPLSYTITVTNNGPLSASSVTVTDTLPGELIFVSSTPGAPDCSFSAGTLTCDLGTMAPTDTAQITIETVLDHPVWGSFSNTSSVTANELDPITANNTATVDTTIALFVDGFETGDTDRWSETAP